jgi:hypothetical protein
LSKANNNPRAQSPKIGGMMQAKLHVERTRLRIKREQNAEQALAEDSQRQTGRSCGTWESPCARGIRHTAHIHMQQQHGGTHHAAAAITITLARKQKTATWTCKKSKARRLGRVGVNVHLQTSIWCMMAASGDGEASNLGPGRDCLGVQRKPVSWELGQ